MAQSLGKKVARIFSVLVAALLICSAAFLFTACETDHPKIKMTIEFNDKSYELTYKLYRNMYPKTVAHYLELIDMDFYDNLTKTSSMRSVYLPSDISLFLKSFRLLITNRLSS